MANKLFLDELYCESFYFIQAYAIFVKQIILTGSNSDNHTSINGNLQFLARMPQIQKWVWSFSVLVTEETPSLF